MFKDFITDFLSRLFSALLSVAGIIGFLLASLFGFIEWKFPNISARWGEDMKLWIWLAPAIVFLLMTVSGTILTSYQIYREQQNMILNLKNELDTAQQNHRPILTVQIHTKLIGDTPVKTIIDPNNKLVSFTVDFEVNNIGDRAAYQNFMRVCTLPPNNPSNLKSMPDREEGNPIYMGQLHYVRYSYLGEYSLNGDVAQVATRVYLRYSDSPTAGIWRDDNMWYFINFNLSNNETSVTQVPANIRDSFAPYVEGYYKAHPSGQ